ncbi:MAG: hypothetical protein WCO33_04460, partial [bacterium]
MSEMPAQVPNPQDKLPPTQAVTKPSLMERIKKIPPLVLILFALAILGVLMLIGVIILFGQRPTNSLKPTVGKLVTTSGNSQDSLLSDSSLSSFGSSGSSKSSLSSLSSSSSSISGAIVNSYASTSSSRASSISSSSVSSVVSTNSSSNSATSSASPMTSSSASIAVDNVNSERNIWCGNTHPYSFTGTITANGSGVVNYYWYRDDTGERVYGSVTFTQAGTKQILPTPTIISVSSSGQGTLVAPDTSLEKHAFIQVQLFKAQTDTVLSNVVGLNFYSLCY